MIHHHLHHIIEYLHTHPHWGSTFAFLIAFIESLAVIGTIVPGSITMTAIGVLIGTAVLPAGATIAWAIAGAYLGDCLSYWFGAHYKNKLRNMWPFKKHAHWLEKGESFFKAHGGKSILIGRFAGPVRSIVPMIAGLLGMPVIRFLLVATMTAFLWALLYMTPGIIIGALSMELPPSLATKFILVCLLILFLLWFLTWLIKFFFDQTWNQIDRILIKWWNYLNINKQSHWLTQALRNPQHEEDHQQLARAVFAFFFFFLFIWIGLTVLHQTSLTHLNLPLYNLLQSTRIHIFDQIFISINLLADLHVLLLSALCILLWLSGQKRWWAALHWLALIAVSLASINFLKRIFYFPRPSHYAVFEHSSSFPSGRTLLSLVLFGFLTVLIADNVPKEKRAPIFTGVIILIFLIGFSNIYLGSHWLTDTLASICLGMVIVLGIVLSYRRHTNAPIAATPLTLVALIATGLIWISYSYLNFATVQQNFAANWPIHTYVEQQWWRQSNVSIPLYRDSRTGQPAQPLNVEWFGDLTTIENVLTQKGWQAQASKLGLGTINDIVVQKTHLPIIPMLYHNRVPALFMTKAQGKGQAILVLRLWQSDILINDGEIPFWLGTISYYQPPAKLLSLPKHKEFQDGIEALIPDLKQFRTRQLIVPPTQQPPEMSHLNWDGKLLLIR